MLKQFLSKYRAMAAPAKASLWFLICSFLQKGIAFFTTPIFTRVMTEAEYGDFSVFNSWLGIFQIILTLNLVADVYMRGLVKNEDDQDRFSSSMLGLTTTCMVIGWCVYALFRKQINDMVGMSTLIMTAMFLEIWATSAFYFWSAQERVHYRYKKLTVLTIAYVFLRPVLGVIFVLLSDTSMQMEARVASTTIVKVAMYTALYVIIARKGKTFFHKDYWTYALKFNLPLLPHYLSQIVLNQSDRLMIDRFCGPREAAFYSVAYEMAMVLQILNYSVQSSMNPWIYKTIKAGREDRIGPVSYGILLLIAASNIFVVVLAPEILTILAPGSYQAALQVIPPVTASVYFIFLHNLFATFEYYYEKTHYVMIASVIGAVLNVVLNAIFIPKFGFIAAGYTTLACYILYAAAHYVFMQKACRMVGRKGVYSPAYITAIGAGFLVIVFAMMLFYHMPVIRYCIVLGLCGLAVLNRRKIFQLLGPIIGRRGSSPK